MIAPTSSPSLPPSRWAGSGCSWETASKPQRPGLASRIQRRCEAGSPRCWRWCADDPRLNDAISNLGVIGNGTIGSLIDRQGRYVWGCLPHLAADPAFLRPARHPWHAGQGFFDVELEGMTEASQRYIPNTAVLVTTLVADDGSAVELTDFAPRFHQFDRLYHPVMTVRRVRPARGAPRIRIKNPAPGRLGRTRSRENKR